MEQPNQYNEIDYLLNNIFKVNSKTAYFPLNELFEQRLLSLSITKHQATIILDIDPKTLASVLSGDSKKVDFVTLLKLSDFLEIPHNEIIEKYFNLANTSHIDDIIVAKKRSFIVNNFNLPMLKKIGFIERINDYEDIERRIKLFFGYDDIFEHGKHKITAAFSSAKRVTNKESLSFWYAAACQSFEKTPNPYEYDRQGLVEFFPKIRWHSMNVTNGLTQVTHELFKLGITLIIVPKFSQDIHVRGATLSYRDKPCIALTPYTKYYASIWFTLLHELYHVLFDWDEIMREQCHISGESESININESEANRFARQYLISDEKMNAIKSHIDEPRFVKYFAEQNHIHPSIIYTFFCYDSGDSSSYYSKYNKQMVIPEFEMLLDRYETQDFSKFVPIKTVSAKRNAKLLTTI